MSSSIYWVRRPARYMGKDCDFGQIVSLDLATQKSEQLTRLGYLVETSGRKTKYKCGECGEDFVSEADRDGHGRKRHADRFAPKTPMDEDAMFDHEESELEKRAPLYMDQTAASKA